MGQREVEASGCLQWSVMKEAFNATGYWVMKREMKRECTV
jgi:hypothetical protein